MALKFKILRLKLARRPILDPAGLHACCKLQRQAATPGTLLSLVLGPGNRPLDAWAFLPQRSARPGASAALARLLVQPACAYPQALALLFARRVTAVRQPGRTETWLLPQLRVAAAERNLPLLDYLLVDSERFISLAALGWVPSPGFEPN